MQWSKEMSYQPSYNFIHRKVSQTIRILIIKHKWLQVRNEIKEPESEYDVLYLYYTCNSVYVGLPVIK